MKMKSTWLFCIVTLIFSNFQFISTTTNKTDVNSVQERIEWPDRVIEIMKEKKQYLSTFSLITGKPLKDDIVKCLLCDVVVTALLMEKSFGMTEVQLGAEAEYFCEILGIEDARVCEGVIEENLESLMYIVENKNVSSTEICSMLLLCDVGKENFEWTVDVPEGTTVDKIQSDGKKTIKIGHISDIHYDPNYVEGKVLDCGEPLCCQMDQENAKNGEEACGYWSSIQNADSSLQLLENAVDEMVKQKPDFVYLTGDLVSHRVWGTSHEFNSKIISTVLDLFASKFKDIPVFAVLGNHEAHPVNVYAPTEITDENLSAQWLFKLSLEKWSKLVGDDTIKETVLNGGYYTVSPKGHDGFRIIVLNNNLCQKVNWWNLYDNNDPYGQLKWLIKTLEESEKNKEVVHILFHVPPSSCLKSWGREYNRILERFSNTVAAQFNGHSHRDQFLVHYNDKRKPIGVTINGGSLLPDLAAPNFKIYTVDATGYDVMEADTYTFDLAAANKNKKIDWIKLYSFTEAFGVENLLPSELSSLVLGPMNQKEELAQKYYNYYYRNSAKGQEECNKDCQKSLLCQIVTTVQGETQMCDSINSA